MRKFAQHGPKATQIEERAATALTKYGFKCTLSDKFSHYDIELAKDGKHFGIAEVKGRDIEWGFHPTIHVSEKKLLRCLEKADELKGCFLFVVVCLSGIYVAHLTSRKVADLERKVGGRKDRDLAHDIETLVDIPTRCFTRI